MGQKFQSILSILRCSLNKVNVAVVCLVGIIDVVNGSCRLDSHLKNCKTVCKVVS